MKLFPVFFLAAASCAQSWAASLEDARNRAVACIERQVPEDTKVSAVRAKSAVSNCEAEIEGWSRALVEGAFDKALDRTDAKMVDAYERVLADKLDLMQLEISDGPHQRLPTI